MSRLSKEEAEEGTIAVLLDLAVNKRIPNFLSINDLLLKF